MKITRKTTQTTSKRKLHPTTPKLQATTESPKFHINSKLRIKTTQTTTKRKQHIEMRKQNWRVNDQIAFKLEFGNGCKKQSNTKMDSRIQFINYYIYVIESELFNKDASQEKNKKKKYILLESW